MLIALAITLLLFLGLLRHLLEPACPGCAAKRWARGSTTLHCAECGWTNVAAQVGQAADPSAAPVAGPQHPVSLH